MFAHRSTSSQMLSSMDAWKTHEWVIMKGRCAKPRASIIFFKSLMRPLRRTLPQSVANRIGLYIAAPPGIAHAERIASTGSPSTTFCWNPHLATSSPATPIPHFAHPHYHLNIPAYSSPMDTVTESDLAIALAQRAALALSTKT